MVNLLKPDPEFRNGYKDKKRLETIANLPCCVCKEGQQRFRTEVHHLKIKGKNSKGIGRRASDLFTIPLCELHHRTGNIGIGFHNGIESWESNFGSQEELLERVNEQLN